MSKSLEDKLAQIAEEAEAGEEDQTIRPIPAHIKVTGGTPEVKVTRGNPRSKVLQIRLNPEELNELERVAESRGLPTSTVGREAILRYLFPDTARSADIDKVWEDFKGQVLEVAVAAAVAAIQRVLEARAPGEAEGAAGCN